MKKSTLILALFLIAFVSCDYPLFVHYTVTNNTSNSIQIKYNYTEGSMNFRIISDSTLNIPSKQTDTLFTYHSVGPRVYNPEYSSDSIKNVSKLELIKLPDNTILQTDINRAKNWTIKSSKRNIATLNYTIN